MNFDVIVCGQISLDLHPGIHHLTLNRAASPGKMFEVGALEIATGGAVANTGLALHKIGVSAGLMTHIGEDMMGDLLTAQIREFGPHLTDLITRSPEMSVEVGPACCPSATSTMASPGTPWLSSTWSTTAWRLRPPG
jgi:hypothetical protein